MDSTELTDTLDDTLKIEEINEKNWIDFMDHMTQFLTANFRRLQNGLVINNTDEINKVYTATFASSEVMKHMISNDVENSILLTHHPIEWNVEGEDENRKPSFIELSPQYLKYMSDHHISLYSAHVPLDRVSEFSTAVTLVQAIGGVWQTGLDFFDYYGTNVGVVGDIPIKDIHDLTTKLSNKFQHPVKLYQYGSESINDGLIGVVGGGGMRVHALEELQELGVNTYITGITMDTPYNSSAHNFAREHGINIIGGTHYSTEKYAMINLANWIKEEFDIPSEFITEQPVMKDIDI